MPAPLIAAVLLAVSARAAEVRDLGTHCTPSEQKVIDKWVNAAREWTGLAKTRVDEGDSTTPGQLAKITGQMVFGPKAEAQSKIKNGETLADSDYLYDPKIVSEKLKEISKILAAPEIRCATKELSEYYYCDPRDGKEAAWEAFTDVKAKVIWLCPKFLAKTGAKNDIYATGRMIHEASHAAGAAEMKYEAYCTAGFTCEAPCGSGEHSYLTADNWAQFAHCASGHEADEEAVEIKVDVSKLLKRKRQLGR